MGRTKENRTEFRVEDGVGLRQLDRQFLVRDMLQFGQCRDMDSIKYGANRFGGGIVRGIKGRLAAFLKATQEIVANQVSIGRFFSTDSHHGQCVFGHGQMADLPSQVGRVTGRLCKPVVWADIFQQRLSVFAGELKILDSQAQRLLQICQVASPGRCGMRPFTCDDDVFLKHRLARCYTRTFGDRFRQRISDWHYTEAAKWMQDRHAVYNRSGTFGLFALNNEERGFSTHV